MIDTPAGQREAAAENRSESSPIRHNLPMPESSSGKPSGSDESTRVEYVVPALDQYAEYFANREDDREKLEGMRKRHNWDQLGFEYGVIDEAKQAQIAKLLDQVNSLEAEIDQQENEIHRLSVEFARLEAEKRCEKELLEIRAQMVADTNSEFSAKQAQMTNLVTPQFERLRLEYLQRCRTGTAEEVRLLEQSLKCEVELQEKEVATLEKRHAELTARLAEIERKRAQPVDLSGNREIYLLKQDIAEVQRQLTDLRRLNQKKQ